jgi:hypothetical protein
MRGPFWERGSHPDIVTDARKITPLVEHTIISHSNYDTYFIDYSRLTNGSMKRFIRPRALEALYTPGKVVKYLGLKM